MAYNEDTAERLREELETVADISEKKMFGGLSFFLGGNMAVGVVGDELCVRVGPDAFDKALELPGARIMDFTGRPMKAGSSSLPRDSPTRSRWRSGSSEAPTSPGHFLPNRGNRGNNQPIAALITLYKLTNVDVRRTS